MKRIPFLMAILAISMNMQAQGGNQDTTPTYPQGATYTHTSGETTLTDDYSCSTQYYNVIQCTGGTLTLNGCKLTKTGNGSGGGPETEEIIMKPANLLSASFADELPPSAPETPLTPFDIL